jgi:hypothetical protein
MLRQARHLFEQFLVELLASDAPVAGGQILDSLRRAGLGRWSLDLCGYAGRPRFDPVKVSRSGHWGEAVNPEEMRDYVWLRPETVAEIKFAQWTRGEVLRHAEFVAQRDEG